MSSGMFGRQMPLGMYGMGMPQMGMDQQQQLGKGKGKVIDFDAAFAQVHASLAGEQAESARITEVKEGEVEELADSLQETSLDKGKSRAVEDEFQEYVV